MKTNREYESMVSDYESRLIEHQRALSRTPDHTGRTKRIRGTDSRYTLKVWFWPHTGIAFAFLIHHHPGQNDCSIFSGSLAQLYEGYATSARSLSDELVSIRSLIDSARSAHHQYLHKSVA